MRTEIFNSYYEFAERSDKDINGVSPEFAHDNTTWNTERGNSSCWNCSRCSDCFDCSRCSDCSGCSDCSDCSGCSVCRDIPKGARAACLTGVYAYTCSPRIHADGEQWIQMGCKLLPRTSWESDPWNNPKEFPNNGSPKSEARMLAIRMAFMWLDANTRKDDQR